jgi:deoxyhypusine monooxygenase
MTVPPCSGGMCVQRYAALFALRNKGGREAVEALGKVFSSCRSALLKHEVAYVLGQLQVSAWCNRLEGSASSWDL